LPPKHSTVSVTTISAIKRMFIAIGFYATLLNYIYLKVKFSLDLRTL